MKRSNLLMLIALICAMGMLEGCYGDEPPINPSVDPVEEMEPSAHLVKVTQKFVYTPEEFVEKLSHSTYASWIGMEEYLVPLLNAFVNARTPELRKIFAEETGSIYASNLRFEQINFDYRTVDVRGDSTTMSGVICYPNNILGKRGHKLSSISLLCHTFYNYNTDCPTFKGDISMGRAMWNSLVVLPDMQGYGSSKQLGDGMKLSNSCARQIVDCERVAIDLVKKMGLDFEDDYYTNIMGYSLGAGPILGVSRYMELCGNEEKDLFKLNSTFVGGGIFNNFDFMADFVRNRMSAQAYFSTMMPTIVYLVKESELGGYKPEDFWTTQYTTVLDTIEGHPTSPALFTYWRFDETEDTKIHKAKVRDFFSTPEALEIFPEDMSTASLVLDPSTPKTKILKQICDKEVAYGDWTPTHSVTFFHPENDEQLPFFLAEDAYNSLKYDCNGGDFVRMETVTIPTPDFYLVSPHYVGTALAQLRMLINEDPANADDIDLLNSILNKVGKVCDIIDCKEF